MKVKAETVLKAQAQGEEIVNEFDTDKDQKLSDEEIQKMLDEGKIDELVDMGVGLEPSGENLLELEFKKEDWPMRMRFVSQGKYYDVLVSYGENDKVAAISVIPLELKIVYPKDRPTYKNWDEASAAIPEGWQMFKVMGSDKDQSLIRITNGKKSWIVVAILEETPNTDNPYSKDYDIVKAVQESVTQGNENDEKTEKSVGIDKE